MQTSAVLRVPELIRAIQAAGVPGLRFCTYLKGPIRIKHYIELPDGAGQTLYIASYRNFEDNLGRLGRALASGKSIADVAADYAQELMQYQRAPNDADLRYFDWLDELIRVTPLGTFPITEEPGRAAAVQFIDEFGMPCAFEYPLPPSFAKTELLHASRAFG